jgi:COP9 signalosome complex subunit 3
MKSLAYWIREKKSGAMDELIPKLLAFPPVPAPAEPLSDFQYDQLIRPISQLLTSTPPSKLASSLSTGEDVFDVRSSL